MKKRAVVGFILFFLVLVGQGKCTTVENYAAEYREEMMSTHVVTEKDFRFCVFPLTPQYVIMYNYSGYLEKQYTEDMIMGKAQETIILFEDKIIATLLISYIGESTSAQIEIPDDFQEYIFLENDKGYYVRCEKVDIPSMGNVIDFFNDTTTITLYFPLMYKKEEQKLSILENTEYIEFIVGGLDFKENKIRYELPLFEMTEDIPVGLKALYEKLDLIE